MRFTVALTLVVGIIPAALASVGLSIPVAQVQTQQPTSETRDAPQLTADEFRRLYDRVTGIWAFRIDKSTFIGDERPPVSQIVIYEPDGDRAIKYTNRHFGPDGKEIIVVSRQVLDGKYHLAPGRSIARMPIDEFTLETTVMRDGRLVSRSTQVYAADGRRMAITGRLIDEAGKSHMTGILVFDNVDKID